MLHVMFQHPHYYAAGILARLSTSAGTCLWGVLVLLHPNTLDPGRFPAYQMMLDVAPSTWWGFGAFIIAASCLFRLLSLSMPHWIGGLAYAAMATLWTFITVSAFMASPYTIAPASGASLVVTTALSIFALVSNPRRYHESIQ